MSLAVKYATRRAYAGDPGIFGAIGGALKGALGGILSGNPLNAITGAISGAVSGAKGTPTKTIKAATLGANFNPTGMSIPVLKSPLMAPRVGPGGGGASVGLQLPGGGSIGFGGIPTVGINAGSVGGVGYYEPGTAVGPVMKRGHLNKTGYFLKDGTYIAPGTKVVANRRQDPLNPRALSRSLRRMQGFARATKHMRSQAAKVANSVAGPKRHSCGTGKRRCK